VAASDSSLAGTAWSNPANALADDAAVAQAASTPTQWLKATSVVWIDSPPASTEIVTGLQFAVKCCYQFGGGPGSAKVVRGGVIGNAPVTAIVGSWPGGGVLGTFTYGGAGDLFGTTDWAISDFGTGFGVVVSGSGAGFAQIQYVEGTVSTRVPQTGEVTVAKTVPLNHGVTTPPFWVDLGIAPKAGTTVYVSAGGSGTWNGSSVCTPAGDPGQPTFPIAGTPLAASRVPFSLVLAQSATDPGSNYGSSIQGGTALQSFAASGLGLWAGMNDLVGAFTDNTGSYSLAVSYVPSAVNFTASGVLFGAETASLRDGRLGNPGATVPEMYAEFHGFNPNQSTDELTPRYKGMPSDSGDYFQCAVSKRWFPVEMGVRSRQGTVGEPYYQEPYPED
jgi:hypothetical protein